MILKYRNEQNSAENENENFARSRGGSLRLRNGATGGGGGGGGMRSLTAAYPGSPFAGPGTSADDKGLFGRICSLIGW